MPLIKYNGEMINVKNSESLIGVRYIPIHEIGPSDLYVSEPDYAGDRYALSLKELEGMALAGQVLVNSETRLPLSLADLRRLTGLSEKIKQEMEKTCKENIGPLSAVSQKTLDEMKLFAPNTRDILKEDPAIILKRDYGVTYSDEELQQFRQKNLLTDLVRGAAFERFKKYYYINLSDEERTAIDKIASRYLNSRSQSSLEDVFKLRANECLGGASGICDDVVTRVDFLKKLRNVFKNITPDSTHGLASDNDTQRKHYPRFGS